MRTPPALQPRVRDPGNILCSFVDLYDEHLTAGRYCSRRARRSKACVLHFGDWLRVAGADRSAIDETIIRRFLDEHLPACACGARVSRQRIINRAALNNLLRLLRARELARPPHLDVIEQELAAFDNSMSEIWGLSQGTRDHRRRIVRRLLRAQFGAGPIDLSVLTPAIVRSFVLGDRDWSTSTIRVMGGAVRCYLRHRELRGDVVAGLLKAVPRPAFWRDSQLPEALTPTELERLFSAFDTPCPGQRRGYAIVRCLADLGSRSSEVVRLTLDDIDWQQGTVRVAAGKARRPDVLPLLPATGQAIADYVVHERPATERREIFVRHKPPIGAPVGRRVVQRTLHAAYARLGWSRTRVHILRHTLASRLINSGTSVKAVADVLRHRSTVTAAGYARVDTTRLAAVALPWPGSLA